MFSSQVPVHSVLVQKSVTTVTNAAGRLSDLDARESCKDAQGASRKKLALRLPATFRTQPPEWLHILEISAIPHSEMRGRMKCGCLPCYQLTTSAIGYASPRLACIL